MKRPSLLLLFGVISAVSSFAFAGYGNKSRVIPLCDPYCVCSGTSSYTSPNPLGQYVNVGDNPTFVVKVITPPTGGTLNVNIEHSCDDGNTWLSVVQVSTTAAGTYYIPVSSVAPSTVTGSSTYWPTIGTSGSTTYSGALQGALGNKWRIEAVSPTTSALFQVFVIPGSKNRYSLR